MTETTLLSCPFCGSKPDKFPSGSIYCSNVKCGTNDFSFSEEKWNTRPNDKVIGKVLLQAYEAMVEDFGDPDEHPDLSGSVAAGETMKVSFELLRDIKSALRDAGYIRSSEG